VIRAFGVSETGHVRKTNEDRFVSNVDLRLFAVADGMGGHRAGEVASELAIETVTAFIKLSLDDSDLTWPYGIDPTLSNDGNRLRTAVCLANRRVYKAAEATEEYAGMGTTLVVVLVADGKIALASVGDSRIYRLSNGSLEQLTVDDSWAAQILSHDNTLPPEVVARHPMRNVLTSVIGARETIDVRVSETTFGDGDLLLLCSDGLHGVIDAKELRQILVEAPDTEAASHRLVDTAIEHGTRDNVTAVVVRSER
jgi:protein phosphatase